MILYLFFVHIYVNTHTHTHTHTHIYIYIYIYIGSLCIIFSVLQCSIPLRSDNNSGRRMMSNFSLRVQICLLSSVEFLHPCDVVLDAFAERGISEKLN